MSNKKEKRVIEINEYHGDISLTLHTKFGDLRVDIELAENKEFDSGNISFFPNGAEGDGFDIARAILKENGDIRLLSFKDVSSEDPTDDDMITIEDIKSAFFLGQ